MLRFIVRMFLFEKIPSKTSQDLKADEVLISWGNLELLSYPIMGTHTRVVCILHSPLLFDRHPEYIIRTHQTYFSCCILHSVSHDSNSLIISVALFSIFSGLAMFYFEVWQPEIVLRRPDNRPEQIPHNVVPSEVRVIVCVPVSPARAIGWLGPKLAFYQGG